MSIINILAQSTKLKKNVEKITNILINTNASYLKQHCSNLSFKYVLYIKLPLLFVKVYSNYLTINRDTFILNTFNTCESVNGITMQGDLLNDIILNRAQLRSDLLNICRIF